MRKFTIIITSLLLLAACSHEDHQANEPTPTPPVAERDSEKPVPAPRQVAAENGKYVEYKEGVIGNGTSSVLFFYASWCPSCKANDELLTSWYNFEEFSRSVHKVDYDTYSELKKRYGVTGQDTFFLIDGGGNEI